MYAWSILAAVATYAAAAGTTDDSSTTEPTTYSAAGPSVQNDADPVKDLMTTKVSIKPEAANDMDVARVVTISGAAAAGQ